VRPNYTECGNAFNTVPSEGITVALERVGISTELRAVIDSYLQERKLMVGDDATVPVTCGVPQGSILGPTLWNIFYNEVLELEVPVGCRTVTFADDIAVLSMGRSEEELVALATKALNRVARWIDGASLKLALQKTEAVLLLGNRRMREVKFEVAGVEITTKKSIKYLGVVLDARVSFSQHVQFAAQKTEGVIAALGRMMPNLRGPSSCTKKLLMSVATSTLLYGSESWGPRLKYKKDWEVLTRTQRRALLRIVGAYRTVSAEAVQVLAGVPPVSLLIQERGARRRNPSLSRAEGRRRTILRWQEQWMEGEKGERTRALVPDLESWLGREHGEVGFYLAQALTGHGCFGTFLHRIGRKNTPGCWYCGEEVDDAKHTLFHCPRWELERLQAAKVTSRWPEESDFITTMLESTAGWKAMSQMSRDILRKKEADERRLEAGGSVAEWE
jgi:hypothetical protein